MAKSAAERKRDQRARAKDAGLCSRCAKRRPKPGRTKCLACMRETYDDVKASRKAKKIKKPLDRDAIIQYDRHTREAERITARPPAPQKGPTMQSDSTIRVYPAKKNETSADRAARERANQAIRAYHALVAGKQVRDVAAMHPDAKEMLVEIEAGITSERDGRHELMLKLERSILARKRIAGESTEVVAA